MPCRTGHVRSLGGWACCREETSSFCLSQAGGAPGLGILLQWSRFWFLSAFRIPWPQGIFCPKLWENRALESRQIALGHFSLFAVHVFRLYLRILSWLHYNCDLLWSIGVKMQELEAAEIAAESSLLLTGGQCFWVFTVLLFSAFV